MDLITRSKKRRSMNDNFDLSNYSETELFDILDLTNPSDRVLEAKIISMIKRYELANTRQGKKFLQFFEDMYSHFFEDSDHEDSDHEDVDENIRLQIEEEEEDEEQYEGFTTNTLIPISEGSTAITKNSAPQLEIEEVAKSVSKEAKPLLIDTQSIEYRKGQVNPILKETITRVIQIDSQYRDKIACPYSTDFAIDLLDPLPNVVSLKLSSVIIPYSWYIVGKTFGSNLFTLQAASPGIGDAPNNVFDYVIQINPGNYDQTTLITNINNAITNIASTNLGTKFGKTGLVYNNNSGLSTFTLDLNILFTETYYELQFPSWTSPFSNNRKDTIPGFLGFLNTTYTCETIYSNYNYAYSTTISPPSAIPISDANYTNGFNDATQQFYITINDPSNGIIGNNYFTIYNYEDTNYPYTDMQSPNEFDSSLSNITILDTITVSFFSTSGYYLRKNIISAINASLQNATTPESFLQVIDISYMDVSSNYYRMQQYELNVVLDRNKTQNIPNMKQAVVFPNESTKPYLWTGLGSCFLFDPTSSSSSSPLTELNNIIAQEALPQYIYRVDTAPYIEIIFNDASYNSTNNYRIDISNGNYTLTEYIAQINNGLFHFVSKDNYVLTNMSSIYYNLSRTQLQFSFQKLYDQTAYTIDLTNCFLHTVLNLPQIISTSDTLNVAFDASFTQGPPYIISTSNNQFTIAPKQSIVGLRGLPTYIATLPTGTYNSTQKLVNAINTTFAGIQGSSDNTVNNTLLHGLNMASSSISITQNTNNPANIYYNIVFNYIEHNLITQSKYTVYLYDSNNSNYFPSNTTSWNYYLGFTDASYSLSSSGTISAQNDIMDISINITSINNTFYFNALPSEVGVYSPTNANNITITIPPNIYTKYQLINEINNQFNTPNSLTVGTMLYPFIDNNGNEHIKLRANINKIFTGQDYNIVFLNQPSPQTCVVGNQGISSITNTLWDTTIGWILGFHSYPEFFLSPSTQNSTNINNYVSKNLYTIIPSTSSNILYNIITITGDVPLNVYPFNNHFYITIDDFTQNHINDGVVTTTKKETYIPLPSYSNKSSLICNQDTGTYNVSLYNTEYGTPNQLLTQNQLYAANQILMNNAENSTASLYSSPSPNIKDMFAVIQLKLTGLQQGQNYVEIGGTLQDNNRIYFGGVNIRRLSIRLISDRGYLVDLNGRDWSFSLICTQLYSSNRI